MTSGLIAILDDITALAKVAASTLDDAGAMAAKAGGKAAGIVIDDAAVTPRYVVGLCADRELPIIGKIAKGSLKNKLLILLPGALGLSFLAPWIITPLLMAGGAFLCMEGYHKVMHLIHPEGEEAASTPGAASSEALEKERVSSAIRTDFILSAEIMAITLAAVATAPLWMQAVVLAVVGLGMTLLVYGVVALIVKADDAGVALARSNKGVVSTLGRALVLGMPVFLKMLSLVGMVAMLWVGGGILIHGLHEMGAHAPEEAVHQAAEAFAAWMPPLHGLLAWLAQAGIAAVLGVVVGAAVDLLVKHLLRPVFARLQSRRPD
jgi:predicted DNA repair protein MutK